MMCYEHQSTFEVHNSLPESIRDHVCAAEMACWLQSWFQPCKFWLADHWIWQASSMQASSCEGPSSRVHTRRCSKCYRECGQGRCDPCPCEHRLQSHSCIFPQRILPSFTNIVESLQAWEQSRSSDQWILWPTSWHPRSHQHTLGQWDWLSWACYSTQSCGTR